MYLANCYKRNRHISACTEHRKISKIDSEYLWKAIFVCKVWTLHRQVNRLCLDINKRPSKFFLKISFFMVWPFPTFYIIISEWIELQSSAWSWLEAFLSRIMIMYSFLWLVILKLFYFSDFCRQRYKHLFRNAKQLYNWFDFNLCHSSNAHMHSLLRICFKSRPESAL